MRVFSVIPVVHICPSDLFSLLDNDDVLPVKGN